MDEEIMGTWQKALEELKNETSPIAYRTYIEVMVPRLVNKNTICFTSPSQYHMEVCTTRYLDLIQNTLKFLTSIDYQIVFEAKDAPQDEQITEFTDESSSSKSSLSKSERANLKVIKDTAGLKDRYTFENFVVGSNNRFAQATAISVCNNLGVSNP